MAQKTLDKQQIITRTELDEQKTLREIQQIREQDEKEFRDRILYIEESNGIKIVSYNNYEIETLFRDLEGKEQVEIEEISLDEKNQLDTMYDTIEEHEQEEMNMDDVDIPEFEEERDELDDFSRDDNDDIDRDEMEF